MTKAFFISDLHGSAEKYKLLFNQILLEKPEIVFIGGDLLGFAALTKNSVIPASHDFFYDYLVVELKKIKKQLSNKYPEIYIILGNDDPKLHELTLLDISSTGLINYAHNRRLIFREYTIVGYSYVPPTPFQNKDWEKYDISSYVDVGCTPPTAGYRSIPVSEKELEYSTIQKDLISLFSEIDLSKTIGLFHSPPYKTKLDRAALDNQFYNHAPLDVHVGSIAIKQFLEKNKLHLSLHGHIHESTRLTGSWKDQVGKTLCFQGASEKEDIYLISFDLDNPEDAFLL